MGRFTRHARFTQSRPSAVHQVCQSLSLLSRELQHKALATPPTGRGPAGFGALQAARSRGGRRRGDQEVGNARVHKCVRGGGGHASEAGWQHRAITRLTVSRKCTRPPPAKCREAADAAEREVSHWLHACSQLPLSHVQRPGAVPPVHTAGRHAGHLLIMHPPFPRPFAPKPCQVRLMREMKDAALDDAAR